MYLGGAPNNVAMHLASLLPEGDTVAIASCLGNDQLGNEAKRRLELKGVRTDYLQFHKEWNTGMNCLVFYVSLWILDIVYVISCSNVAYSSLVSLGMAIAMIDENGDATYQFNTPAAWDGLQLNNQISNLINNENDTLFIVGSIAARLQSEKDATSASTIRQVRNNAMGESIVLDVNLRSPWYDSKNVLDLARGQSSNAKKLALLKLNEEELVILEDWCDLKSCSNELSGVMLQQRMRLLASSLNANRICVTRGANGAAIWCEDNDTFHENSGYTLNSTNDSDTVGAGDAFLASLVNSLFIWNETPIKALEHACALGAYVANCRGATPDHNDAPLELKKIFQRDIELINN